MKDKEIIFISNFYGDGGAARVISVLADELSKKGYKVTIASFPLKNKEEYIHLEGVDYVKFNMHHKEGFLYKIERILKIRNLISKNKNATVISFEYFMNMQTIVAMFGLKNKLIISERNDPSRVGGRTPMKQLRNFLYHFADCLVCQTNDALEYFPTDIMKKSVVIMNPIKDGLPLPWEGVRKKQIVNFCRLEKQKNLPLLIDSFAEFYKTHNDYTLIIYGDGNERRSLEEYIKERKLDNAIILHPAVQDIHEKIKDAMMFVSSSDYEGLSNSMIEAMAIGLPVICTDCPCGGARMVIEDGKNGILVPVNCRKALVDKLDYLSNHEDVRREISDRGSEVKELLSVKNIVDKWIAIL